MPIQFPATFISSVSASGDPTGMPVTSGLLYRWNSAQGVTTSAGLVTQWNDQASTNHVYSSGYSPTYVSSFDRFNGKPSIRFAAGNVLAGTSLTPIYGNADRTVVAIVRTINAGDATFGDNIISQSDAPIARYNAGSWPYYYPVALSTRGIHGWDPVPDYLPSEMPTKATQCIVWTHASTGTATTLRRNGVAVGGATLNFTENQGYTVIGKGMQNSGHDIDADYADLLIFNRVLNSTEISQIEAWAQSYYNIDYSFDNVSLLLHMDGANGSTIFTDSSSNALTVTANGNAKISTAQTQSGFGQAGYFDGSTNTFLSVTSSILDVSSSDLTVDLWFYTSDVTSTSILFEQGTGASGDVQCYLYNGSVFWGTSGASGQVSMSVSANTWNFISCVKSGTSFFFYLNGTKSSAITRTANSKTALNIAARSGGSLRLNGYVDEFRWTKVVRQSGAFMTVPTAPFPNS